MELFGIYMNSNDWLLILGVVLLLAFVAQGRVQRVFARYAREQAAGGIPAARMAEELLARNGSDVTLTRVSGRLTDHFDPRNHTVGLSEQVYDETSVSALAVAAHEIGHVLQYQEGYGPIRFRNTLLPVASIGSRAGPWIIIIGAMIGNTTVATVGLVLYAAMFVFQLVTLPVEFNASARGLAMLEEGGYVSAEQRPMAKKVLSAAATTYVMAAIGSFVSLLRFLTIINSRSRRS